MTRLKALDVGLCEKNLEAVRKTIEAINKSKFNNGTPNTNSAKAAVISRWLDGILIDTRTAQRWASGWTTIPATYRSWASIRRLFQHNGYRVSFYFTDKHHGVDPHPLNGITGFPFILSTDVSTAQINWVKNHPLGKIEKL